MLLWGPRLDVNNETRRNPTTDLAVAQGVFTEAIIGSRCEQVW